MADESKTAVQDWVSGLTTGSHAEKRKPKSATVVIRAYGILAAILDGAVDDRRVPVNPTLVLVLAYCGLRRGKLSGFG